MRNEIEFARVTRVAMILALPLWLAACAPEEGEELYETPEATTPGGELEEAAEPLQVDIVGDEGSEVDGEATLTQMGDSFTVALSLENLPGQGPFQAHIHAGTCEDRAELAETAEPGETARPGETEVDEDRNPEQDRVLVPLEPVTVGGAMGATEPAQPGTTPEPGTEGQVEGMNSGMSTTTVAKSQLEGQEEAFIQVHGEGGRAIACGNIADLGSATLGTGTGTTPGSAPGQPGGTEPNR